MDLPTLDEWLAQQQARRPGCFTGCWVGWWLGMVMGFFLCALLGGCT